MTIRLSFLLALALTACSRTEPPQPANASEPAAAQVVAPDAVRLESMMVTQPLTATPGDPARGREYVASRSLGNCLACHRISALDEEPFHGDVGPSLDGAGTRWQEGHLRALVVNAKSFFPTTVMPAYYRTSGLNRVRDDVAGQPILKAQQVEDVIAFLKTLK